MNSFERYEKMMSLTPYNDRSEMPIMPMMLTTYGPLGGKTQKEILDSDPQNWMDATLKTWEIYGKPDVAMPMCPCDTTFVMGLPVRLPGRDLGDNELYQFVETPYFDDISEYDRILKMGIQAWNAEKSMKINGFKSFDEMGARYARLGANSGRTQAFLAQNGVVSCFDGNGGTLFDNLSMTRSMAAFTYDLYDCPGKIMDVIRAFHDDNVANSVETAKKTGAHRIAIFAMRSSATFISPDIYDEFVWPFLKDCIMKYHEAGFISILHADGNWLPMFEHFTELPKGCLNIELDGDTEIHQAYEIIKGCQTIRGDVPATMFAFGSPEDIYNYSEDLIQMGMAGGFMLSSGCEIPLNAKPENVMAFMDALGRSPKSY